MGNAGNEKQADQEGGLDWLPPHDAPDGKAWHCPECPSWAVLRENAHAHQMATGHGRPAIGEQPPAPLSAEKLALRGEPTARTLMQRMVAYFDEATARREALGPLLQEASAYLSTRAPAEEALIEAGYRWANAERACQAVKTLVGPAARQAIHERQQANEDTVKAALALPVEGRAPDHEHDLQGNSAACGTTSEQLGKKGGE